MLSVLVAGMVSTTCIPAEELYERVNKSVVEVTVYRGIRSVYGGTGLVIDRSGTVITSTHVIDKGTSITTTDSQGVIRNYLLHKKGQAESVSVLVNRGSPVSTYLPIFKYQPRIGTQVYTIGFPLTFSRAYTSGMITSYTTTTKAEGIVANLAIAPGSSGGPVFDCRGRVLGFAHAYHSQFFHYTFINPVSDALELLK